MAAAPHLTFPPRKLWTRDECAQMASFVDLDRYELIEGELVEKVSKNHPHTWALMRITKWLQSAFDAWLIVPESPIDVRPEDNPTSQPEPDVFVVNRSYAELIPRPRPENIVLLVEVSDSTLMFDLTLKRDLYARAAIAEYWVVDVNGRRIIVHRDPVAGSYRSIVAHAEDESVALLAAPQHSTLVSALV